MRSPKTLWIAIGDSITYLNEHPDEAGNRITKGYMTRVVEKIPDIEYINQGHNGWTSGGIADKIEELGLVRADVYSVFLLKDPSTGLYKNFRYPSFIDIPFDTTLDEYPYPVDAIGMTYDGLHPSDKGYEVIAKSLARLLKN
ncbi:MAG: SGNH/GDSL hydrolase family protein [Saprospiraceae bacterium]|nr:SGNH/GDSL hydrolase family protein [Saprospiraceae bacterium]